MKNTIYELLDLKKINPIISEDNDLTKTINLNNLNEESKIKTSKENKKKKLKRFSFPHGMKLVKIKTKYTNEFLFKKMEEIRTFFVKHFHEKIKSNEYVWETFSKISQGVKTLRNLGETVNIIEKIEPGYEKYILLFFDQIMKHLKVGEKEYKRLLKETYFGLFKYRDSYFEFHNSDGIEHIKTDSHVRCHIDGVKDKQDISVYIGLGAEYYYDFVPYFFTEEDNLSPFRINVKPLQAIVLDGESRIAWQHCLPGGYIRKVPKMTLKFKIPISGKFNKKYNKLLRKNFYTSI